ncbi:MAG: methyltransferase domain-containing protein [Phycisphaeraceae bacterium]
MDMTHPTTQGKLYRPASISRIGELEIRLPEVDSHCITQDAEWCEVCVGQSAPRRVRFHDYHEIYQVPGLYEALFYETLECCSPQRVTGLLEDVLHDWPDDASDLRVLDVGAGNGMVGQELRERGTSKIVGIDIIPEARDAALRDRPDVYEDYFVADLTDLDEHTEEAIRKARLNCLTTVAALGFGDIPPQAFLKALDLIATPGWLAFNIKEDFIDQHDGSGFCELVRELTAAGVLRMQAYRRYTHRKSLSGEPLHYVAMIATKDSDRPDAMMEHAA